MSETKEKIEGENLGGIYYTDRITGDSGEGTLTAGKIVFTDDVSLIGLRVAQVEAMHLKQDLVLIRGKL